MNSLGCNNFYYLNKISSHEYFFDRLFMHRYRDVDSDIRVSCIRSLGVWILSYPSLFLQDLYLKYLGWTLNDKVGHLFKKIEFFHPSTLILFVLLSMDLIPLLF